MKVTTRSNKDILSLLCNSTSRSTGQFLRNPPVSRIRDLRLHVRLFANNTNEIWKNPSQSIQLSVFFAVTSPYTIVYDEIQHTNGPYFIVIQVTVLRTIYSIIFMPYTVICVSYRSTHQMVSINVCVHW